MKTAVKSLETAIEERESKETIDALYKTVSSVIDRVAGKGVIKSATASRKISRLAKAIAKCADAPKAAAPKSTKKSAAKSTKKTAKKSKD